jgi:class 3 adenylate cyclase
VIATTDPAKERLHAYVAPFALEWLATSPERRHRSVDATVVFIDVSGFTALTERLAARGKAGAEEVSEVIGGAFAELLGVADAYGGELLKWGGDAALLLFRDSDAAARGCGAAWLMSKMMARIGKVRTSAGRVELGVSAGVNSGRFDLYLLGDEYRELVVTGPAATMTAELEHDADAGEVLVAASTAALIDPAALGQPKGRGVLLRAAPSAAVASNAGAPAPADVRGVDPGMLLCPTVRDHLLGGGERAEHRYASIAFIEFSGVDDAWTEGGPALVEEALDVVVRRAQHAAQDHGVTFFYTDIGPDGGKILLTGGVPVVSGNDEERLLRAACRVVSDHAGPLQLRAGLNAGRFFVHDAGREERRVYSFSGDAVNLAARVMARAQPGEVLATNSLLDRVRSNVRAQPLPPFLVKGKIEPVLASRVLGFDRDSEATRDGEAFIGREQ